MNNKSETVDPRRRVFVPVEGKTSRGVWTFSTLDGKKYYRAPDGSIRNPGKVNGKQAKRARHEARETKKC